MKRTITLAAALTGTLLLTGCPEEQPSAEYEYDRQLYIEGQRQRAQEEQRQRAREYLREHPYNIDDPDY